MPAKPKTIGNGIANLHLSGRIGHIIEVTFRIWSMKVDGRMNNPVFNGQGTGNKFDTTTGTKGMPNHAFSTANCNFFLRGL